MGRISKARLGAYLRRQRIKQDLTIDQLATLCQLHRNSVQAIEAGRVNISITTLESLARGLRVGMDSLLAAAQGEKSGEAA